MVLWRSLLKQPLSRFEANVSQASCILSSHVFLVSDFVSQRQLDDRRIRVSTGISALASRSRPSTPASISSSSSTTTPRAKPRPAPSSRVLPALSSPESTAATQHRSRANAVKKTFNFQSEVSSCISPVTSRAASPAVPSAASPIAIRDTFEGSNKIVVNLQIIVLCSEDAPFELPEVQLPCDGALNSHVIMIASIDFPMKRHFLI